MRRRGLFKISGLILGVMFLLSIPSWAGVEEGEKPAVLANTEQDLISFYVLLPMAQKVKSDATSETLSLSLDPADAFEIQESFKEQVYRMKETYVYLLNNQILDELCHMNSYSIKVNLSQKPNGKKLLSHLDALGDPWSEGDRRRQFRRQNDMTYEEAQVIFCSRGDDLWENSLRLDDLFGGKAWAQIASVTGELARATDPLEIGVIIDRIHNLVHNTNFLAKDLFHGKAYWLRVLEIAAVSDGFFYLVGLSSTKLKRLAFRFMRNDIFYRPHHRDGRPIGYQIIDHSCEKADEMSEKQLECYLAYFQEIPEVLNPSSLLYLIEKTTDILHSEKSPSYTWALNFSPFSWHEEKLSFTWSKEFWAIVSKLLLSVQHRRLQEGIIIALRTQKEWPEEVWTVVPKLLERKNHRILDGMISTLRSQAKWPVEVWEKVPHLLVNHDDLIREKMFTTLQTQKEWPKEFWANVPWLLKYQNPPVRVAMAKTLRDRQKNTSLSPEAGVLYIPDLPTAALKAYGSSFGLYFLGREGAHLILSVLDGKFAEVDQMIESLFDWREHAEFAGFAGVMAGTEMATDLAMVQMLGPEKLPILRSIVKHSMGMMVAMELTSLSREYLENPEALPMILDRHLSKENLVRLIGVTASFLVSRPFIQYGIGSIQAIRHGTKVTAWSPQGFLAKAGLEVMVFTTVGLAERYLLPTADRIMLSSSLEDQIESLQEKTKNNTLSEKDLLALEETYQYIIQYHMNDFIKERQEFMDGFKEDVETAAQKDPKSIQMRDHAVQRMQQNPSYFTDFDTILDDRNLEREPIKQDEQIRLKTQEMIRIASASADRWEAYRKEKAQGKIENWLEEMGQEEEEIDLYAFPQTIAQTFWHQRKLLDSLLTQAPDERRIILQDAQKRLEARKLMFGRTLEELIPQ